MGRGDELARPATHVYGDLVPPARFVTDSSLEHLARRLRFLGYDVATAPAARLEDLFAIARAEGRTVLTLSPRHPRRWADVPALVVPRGDPVAALRGIAAGHEPAGPPFSRCPECNTPLERRLAIEARGEVPARVTRGLTHLTHCPHCGRWYWEGSHVARVREWLERALGRRVGPDARA